MTDKWRIKRGNKEHGPISSQQLREFAKTGKLQPTDLVRNNKSDWKQASSISGLFPRSGNRVTPPKLPSAQLAILRNPKITGFLSTVSIKIDGEGKGSLGGGFPSGILDLLTSRRNEMSLEVAPGTHQIEVSGGGLHSTKSIDVKPGQVLRLITLFSNMGAMGGGLRLEEDPSGASFPSQTSFDPKTERKSGTLKGIVGLGVVCFGFFILCAGILGGIVGSSRGTSTSEQSSNTSTQRHTNSKSESVTSLINHDPYTTIELTGISNPHRHTIDENSVRETDWSAPTRFPVKKLTEVDFTCGWDGEPIEVEETIGQTGIKKRLHFYKRSNGEKVIHGQTTAWYSRDRLKRITVYVHGFPKFESLWRADGQPTRLDTYLGDNDHRRLETDYWPNGKPMKQLHFIVEHIDTHSGEEPKLISDGMQVEYFRTGTVARMQENRKNRPVGGVTFDGENPGPTLSWGTLSRQ
ncbi:DUF4339 domain-containing protein [Gimesia maris]|uniref:DUF4339 domain-containing protein n=1 Tax=Gimesia maris TaxID=122 RepID=UPI0032EDA73E